MVALTIGMATYDDFDGVYFTIQALRLYQDLADTELLVVDNYGCDETEKFVTSVPNARYLRKTEVVGTAVRELVFTHARGDAVLCIDSHILFPPGTIARLRDYYAAHPETRDLLQGPLLNDDLTSISTHFDPEWRGQMWGTWGIDPRGLEVDGEAFDIPSQGLGVFSCRRERWPGFNPAFRGFGGEEGYIHEKFRQRGGRTLCLPWLRWVHRFGRPKGVPYPLSVEMKLRNYIIGFTELGLDTTEAEMHFAEFLTPRRVRKVKARALADHAKYTLPLISCICATFGRLPTEQLRLEEAIQSFLLQDYPNKELILVNDCPGQELACDAPGVRVVNVPARFPSLAHKLDAGVASARGDLIATWDHHSISLPWRLSLSWQMLGHADYINSQCAWLCKDGVIMDDDQCVTPRTDAPLFRRDAIHDIGGYASLTCVEGQTVAAAMCTALASRRGEGPHDLELQREDWFCVRHWGEGEDRRSSGSDAGLECDTSKRPRKPARYVLQPHWRVDYLAAIEASVRSQIRIAVVGDEGQASGHRLPFGRDDQRPGETAAQHLERVRERVAATIAMGGTHLLIPRDEVDWIGSHAHLEEYFSQVHDFLDAGQDQGLVFALRSPDEAMSR